MVNVIMSVHKNKVKVMVSRRSIEIERRGGVAEYRHEQAEVESGDKSR